MRTLPLFALLVLTACSAKEPSDQPYEDDDDDDALPSRCTGATAWAPGTAAFREATSDWQLDTLGVEGTRLNAVDFDADGYPDSIVRRPGGRSDDAAGARSFWLLRNTGAGTFEDVTHASGILATRRRQADGAGRPGEVLAFADVDNDGDLDAYVGLATEDPALALGETSELLLNDGSGGFVLADSAQALRRDVDAPGGASFVDFDRDGLVDLWVTEYAQQDRLYKGGTLFTDVTAEAGLATAEWTDVDVLNEARAHTLAWAAAACDLDGDGDPELLSASYGRSPNHLWQARAGAYENRSLASGYAYDDDLSWTDNQFARCYCQDNPRAERCADVPAPLIACDGSGWDHALDRQPFRLGGNSASTSCGDLDNDGDLDLVTGEIRHWWAGRGSDPSEVLVNTGEPDVRFERPGDAALGLEVAHAPDSAWDEGHMTQALFDFDNDGWLDLYQGASDYPGNRGLLYRQSAPLQFSEVPPADGIAHNRSHGVVVADFDRDGDLDLVAGHSTARCEDAGDCYPSAHARLFENLMGGNWVQLALEGAAGTNRAAIGARVTLTTAAGTQTREIGGGHGHYGSQHELVVHFGLGAACEAAVTVRWPDAALTTQTFAVQAGYRYTVRQGETPSAQ